MRVGPFASKRVFICSVNQDPVGFNVAVERRLPRSDEWMVFVACWKEIYKKKVLIGIRNSDNLNSEYTNRGQMR